EEDEDDHAHQGDERCRRPVPAMATTRLQPRLFEQRLDEGFDLVAVERLTVGSCPRFRGRTRRGGNGAAYPLDSTLALVLTSVMISVKLNKADRTDLYLQVAAEIRRAIAEGEAKPGERIPAARDLATVLGVNTNTVLRSLRLLQEEGLIDLRRG